MRKQYNYGRTYSTTQVAIMYGVTVEKVRKWANDGLLRIHRGISGTGYIFKEDDLERFEWRNKQYKRIDMDKETRLKYIMAGIDKCQGVICYYERCMQDERYNLEELLSMLKEEVA